VDGGYTQQDIIAVARALTGWTLAPLTNVNPLVGPGRPFLYAPVDKQVDGAVQMLLGGIATPGTREVLLATSGEPAQRLREILVLALGSPEFQRR